MPNTTNLETVWAAWCSLVAEQDVDAEGSRGYLVVHDRLSRVSPDHAATKEHVETILDVLYRGVPLLLAALGWYEPTAGSRGGRNAQTDRARGDQWRLVMAFGGFETLARGLLACPEKTFLTKDDFAALLAHCRLPRYEPLPTPEPREAVREKWFQPDVVRTPRHPLLAFLGVHNGDAEVLQDWLVTGRPIDDWATALRLAQALRNVTTHGALSATKVREWKLREVCERLTDDLQSVAAAALRALVVREPGEAESTPEAMARGAG